MSEEDDQAFEEEQRKKLDQVTGVRTPGGQSTGQSGGGNPAMNETDPGAWKKRGSGGSGDGGIDYGSVVSAILG
jgi:hypothetical protein